MKNTLISAKQNPIELVLLLAVYTSLGALTIDLQLPAMPLILQSFGFTESNQQQWIITAYMLGFAVAQIFYGPVSDSIGRKTVLIFGLLVYIVASVMCIVVDSYYWFLAARALQGVGAAAARIMVNAITRDFYAGNEMAKITSLVMIIFIMVPVLAPTLGSLILWAGPWQNILYVFVGFGVLALVWTLIRLPESIQPNNQRPFNFVLIKSAFMTVIKEPISMVFAVVSGVIFSGFMAYLNGAEQIYSNIYQAKHLFPYLFGVIALFFGVAAFINAKIVMKFGALTVTNGSMGLMVASTLLYLVITFLYQGVPPLWTLVVMLIVINMCIGLVYGNVMAIAMYPLGAHAGMGASVIGMVSALLAAGLGIMISQQLDQTIYPIVIGFFLTSLTALLLIRVYGKDIEMD
ncbi:multidrug effflux MFS transporter [Marinicella litoralis]|uniref:Bcr/CflA family efflux transporter n=1 Tax=Marinicella litoralis TaxID=644220 RepID=A0A4R6XQB1_9GAMM|nr:multidrug effflux MFS transporter [Marinicella litoralis]TDR20599.1 DHA1 family bicyclomycin/chloramphenicol resistance-like MFS transporter [Marinicella litoralis]